MGWIIGRIILLAKNRLAQAGVAGTAASAVGDLLNIDFFREQAVKISPTSDPEALEEASRAVHWMMGLSDADIVGPPRVIDWKYFHYNPQKGQGWWTRNYNSRKTVKSSARRGAGRGFGRGFRRAIQTQTLGRDK